MGAKHTIRIDQGATWRLRSHWREPLRDLATGEYVRDVDGNVIPGPPISLDGYFARMHIRKALNDVTPMLELTTDNGGILITQPVVRLLDYVQVATSSNIALTGLQTIDGVLLEAGDRVLVRAQSTANDNGIYVAAAGSWARASDAQTYQALTVGATVWVRSGALNGDAVFYQSATLGSLLTAQVWGERDDIGEFQLVATDEQTDALTSSGVYDVELESVGGDVHRVLQGKMRLSQAVTREDV